MNNAKKCLPNKIIENGKPTFWNEKEITVLLEFMKTNNPNKNNLPKSIEGITTSMTNAMKIEMLHKQIEVILQDEIKELKSKNQSLLEELGQEKSYRSIKAVEMETGKHFKYSELRKYSKEKGYEIHKAFDQNYGEVNTYHIDVWQAVYGIEL